MIITHDINLYKRSENTSIRISEDGDGLGMVHVRADTKFFGDINFSMSVEDAQTFAEAILMQVKWIKEAKRG